VIEHARAAPEWAFALAVHFPRHRGQLRSWTPKPRGSRDTLARCASAQWRTRLCRATARAASVGGGSPGTAPHRRIWYRSIWFIIPPLATMTTPRAAC